MSKLKYYDGTDWKIVNGQVTGDTLPIGAIVPFGGWDAPTGWLICDGTLLNKTDYPELFNAIGYSFGGEEGGSTFGLPDLRGKVPVGQDTTQTEFDTMGETGGEKTHTLTISEMPSHTHAPNSRATTFSGSGANNPAQSAGDRTWENLSIGNTGGGQAHNNLQPYQTVNYIIKAKQSAGLVANVSNIQSESTTDTYSCDYVNNLVGGTILYNTSGGTSGDVTLSDSAANYKYLRILYRNGDGYSGTTDVLFPNNSKTTLTLNYYNAGTSKFMHWAGEISINGTTITHTTDYYYENNNGSVNAPQSINYISILTVIGYK